jgi:hypothetical protein
MGKNKEHGGRQQGPTRHAASQQGPKTHARQVEIAHTTSERKRKPGTEASPTRASERPELSD